MDFSRQGYWSRLPFPSPSCGMGGLIPWTGIEARPPALGVGDSHWTAREVPLSSIIIIITTLRNVFYCIWDSDLRMCCCQNDLSQNSKVIIIYISIRLQSRVCMHWYFSGHPRANLVKERAFLTLSVMSGLRCEALSWASRLREAAKTGLAAHRPHSCGKSKPILHVILLSKTMPLLFLAKGEVLEDCCFPSWLLVCRESESHSVVSICDPMDSTVHGILQARTLEWVAFPFSRRSSWPRYRTQVSHIAGGFFTSWTIRQAQAHWSG